MGLPFSNITNVTGFEQLINYNNLTTGNMFGIFTPITFAAIIFLSLTMFRVEHRVVVASFVGLMIASLFWILGELAFVYVGFWLVFLIGSAAFLIKAGTG